MLVRQLRLLTAAYYLKHGSSKAVLDDFLSILKAGIPELEDDQQMKSPHLYLKKYKLLSEGPYIPMYRLRRTPC
jgi:hypothetical protein